MLRVFLSHETKGKLKQPNIFGSMRVTGINPVIPWTENNRACKLAKFKPPVPCEQVGNDPVGPVSVFLWILNTKEGGTIEYKNVYRF